MTSHSDSYIVRAGLGGLCDFVCTLDLCKVVKKNPPAAWAVGGLVIGATLCMFFIDNRLLGKLFSFVFPLDKLDYGWYVTCGVYVKIKVGRTSPPGRTAKKRE